MQRLQPCLTSSFCLLIAIALTGAVFAQPPFDLETGDPLREAIIPRLVPALTAEVSPTLGDVTMVNRVNSVVILALMDALAPYHPTAVGAYTRVERRPEEARTQANMNAATLHAGLSRAYGHDPDARSCLARDAGNRRAGP